MLSHLDMAAVHEHYMQRWHLHKAMVQALAKKDHAAFLQIALGISDPAGNYSAAEHHLGPKILMSNSAQSIVALAEALKVCVTPKKVPEIIQSGNVKNLKISVGSEMSMMLQPDRLWTANVRTVWAHLLIETGDNFQKANDALSVYRSSAGNDSDMTYKIWSEIHPLLQVSMTRLSELGNAEAKSQNVNPGIRKFLWADAIANELYRLRSEA